MTTKLINFTTGFLFLVLLTVSSFGQDDQLKQDLQKSFKKFDLVRVNNQEAVRSVNSERSFKFATSEKNYDLVLEPKNLLSRRYRAENTGANGVEALPRPEVKTFRGKVENESGSHARFTISENLIEGYFVSSGEMFFVEPAKRYSKDADEAALVIYRKNDHLKNGSVNCRSDFAEKIYSGSKMLAAKGHSNLTAGGVIEIATEADFEFVTLFADDADPASAANADILGILNMTEGVYEEELNLTIEVVFQHTWSVADPLSGTNSETLNTSFKDYWNLNYPTLEIPRDTAHLFTAKAYSMSQGYAYIGSICANPPFAYGLSGRMNPAWNWHFGNFLVTTHEVAHNLSADHAETTQSCGNTVMNSVLGGSTALSFCEFSRNVVGNFVSTSGSCLAPPVSSSSTKFDFDGDARSDVSIFRPADGQWWVFNSSDASTVGVSFGVGTDELVPADFTGDGKTDVALFRPSTNEWIVLRSEDFSFYAFPFGAAGDIPAPGDFDGDGLADATVYRPSTGTWFTNRSTDGGLTVTPFGVTEDKPVVADYDGDGLADIAIYRPSVSQWWLNQSTEGVVGVSFGASGDQTVQGDWTGDGKDDVALFRPSTSEWIVLRSEDFSFYAFPFGTAGDIPAAGDYDGDGMFDATVFRPSATTWFKQQTTSGFEAVPFGLNGDVAIPSVYAVK